MLARVLMIEDNPNDQKLVSLLLATSLDFSFAASLEDAVNKIKECRPDAVLLDLNLPDSKGVETIRAIARQFPELPIVVWSGADDAANAVHAGADQFVLKDGDLTPVEPAIRSAMSTHKFKSAREDLHALQKMIETDKK